MLQARSLSMSPSSLEIKTFLSDLNDQLMTMTTPAAYASEPLPVAAAKASKKIPPDLRRALRPPRALSGLARWRWRMQNDSQYLRLHVQTAFTVLVLWIGVEFVAFVHWLEKGGAGTAATRPPGVEGFLPLSALISLKHWFLTGRLNLIHPSAVFIFLAIAATGVLLKKSFCGWLCPVGFLSELHWKLWRFLFRGNVRVHSDECMACLACTQACPVKHTLDLKTAFPARRIPAPVLAALMLGLFVAITGAAMLAGVWQNAITTEDYLRHMPRLEAYGHPGR